MSEATAWHFLGPWTGYYIGIVIAAFIIFMNRRRKSDG